MHRFFRKPLGRWALGTLNSIWEHTPSMCSGMSSCSMPWHDDLSCVAWFIYSFILEYILKVPHRTLCGMKGDCLLSHCEIWQSHSSDYKDEFLLRYNTMCLSKNLLTSQNNVVDCFWNVMAHAQKPDFVFRRYRRVHLNRQGHQFSRLLAAEVFASAVVMLDTPSSEVAWEYWLPTPFASFPSHVSPCAITFQLDCTNLRSLQQRLTCALNNARMLPQQYGQ